MARPGSVDGRARPQQADLLHVGSGTERRIGPGEDDNIDVDVCVGLDAQLLQPLPHGHREGVSNRGTVEHHGQDAVGMDLLQARNHGQRGSSRWLSQVRSGSVGVTRTNDRAPS